MLSAFIMWLHNGHNVPRRWKWSGRVEKWVESQRNKWRGRHQLLAAGVSGPGRNWGKMPGAETLFLPSVRYCAAMLLKLLPQHRVTKQRGRIYITSDICFALNWAVQIDIIFRMFHDVRANFCSFLSSDGFSQPQTHQHVKCEQG